MGAGSTVPRLNRRCGCVGYIAEIVEANGSNEVVGRSGAQGGSAGRLAASLRSLKSYAAKNCCYLRTTSRCALSSHEHLHVRKQGMAGAGWRIHAILGSLGDAVFRNIFVKGFE